ncbi:MAG: hypothetical protein HY810_07335 [Candidatus Omnitrophica bacterium]|nr:hypothetical protein [Candidatus Omnitrophota bacterium]
MKNKFLKPTVILVIYAFLLLDFLPYSCGADIESFEFKKNNLSATLSPQLRMDAVFLQRIFKNPEKDFVNLSSSQKGSNSLFGFDDSVLQIKDGLEKIAEGIADGFVRKLDKISESVTGRDSFSTILQKIINAIKELEGREKKVPKEKRGNYFKRPKVIGFVGKGGTGKTFTIERMLTKIRRIGYLVKPELEKFDHNLRQNSDRQIYFGRPVKMYFTPEYFKKLQENQFIRTDASDENYAFWLLEGVIDDADIKRKGKIAQLILDNAQLERKFKNKLSGCGFNSMDIDAIWQLWEKTSYRDNKGSFIGQTTEVVTEKFDMEQNDRTLSALLKGDVALRTAYDTKLSGVVKIGLDENNYIVIYIGGETLRWVSSADSGVWQSQLKDSQNKQYAGLELGETSFAVRSEGIGREEKHYLSLGEAEYVDRRGIRRKMSEFIVEEDAKKIWTEIPEIVRKDNIGNITHGAEVISMAFAPDGSPRIIYKTDKLQSLEFATLNIRCGQDRENVVLYINEVPHIYEKQDWGKDVLLIRTYSIDLEIGKQVFLKERVIPGSRVIFAEGIGITAGEKINKRMISVIVCCLNKIRFFRVAKRGKSQKGKGQTAKLLAQRFLLQYTEEPFIIEWENNCEFGLMAMSIEEVLFMLNEIASLEDAKAKAFLKELGFDDLDEFRDALNTHEWEAIRKKLSGKDWYEGGKLLSNSREPLFYSSALKLKIWKFITDKVNKRMPQKGFLINLLRCITDFLSPVIHMDFDKFFSVHKYEQGINYEAAVDMDYFEKYYEPFFYNVLQPRMGGNIVPRDIIVLENKKSIPANEKGAIERNVRKFMALSNVSRSAIHDLVNRKRANDLLKAKSDIDKYIELEKNMIGNVVPLDSNMGNYAFRQIIENGNRLLELNRLYHVTANPLDYTPAKYDWDKVTKRRIPSGEFLDERIIEKLNELGVIRAVEGYPYYLYFDDSINDEEQLKERINLLDTRDISEILRIWRDYPSLGKWPELQEYYEAQVRKHLPANKAAYLWAYIKKRFSGKPDQTLSYPFDYDIIDETIESLKAQIQRARLVNIMLPLFLKEKAGHQWGDFEAFSIWLKLLEFLSRKDENDLTLVLRQLYEQVRKDEKIAENGSWEKVLSGLLKEQGMQARFQRLKDDIGLFKVSVNDNGALNDDTTQGINVITLKPEIVGTYGYVEQAI